MIFCRSHQAVALIVAALHPLAPQADVAPGNLFEFRGTAKNDAGATLYREQHRVQGSCQTGVFRARKHRVVYTRQERGNRETFAEKNLDYNQSPLRPAVSYQQPDFNESLEITYPDPDTARTVAVVWRQPGGGTERASVAVSDNLVIDAGFDHLIRHNWGRIADENSVPFRFLAPTRGTDYAFVMEPATSQTIQADHLVQIRPDSLMLRFVVDPITLGYNEKGALTAYSGLTNVRENADRNYTATIRYTVQAYPECPLMP